MSSPYRSHSVTLRAEIGQLADMVTVDVLSANIEWGVNAIPRAVLTLAVGRTGNEAKRPAAVHKALDRLQYKTPARIYATIEVTGSSLVGAGKVGTDDFPQGEFLLFEGYASHYGFAKSIGSAGFNLVIEHWTASLTFSSAVSGVSHPSNPLDLLFPSTVRLASPDTAAGRAASGGLTGIGLAQSVMGADATEDLWGKAILRWYDLIVEKDHLLDPAIGGGLQLVLGLDGTARKPNAAAQEALARMRPRDDMPALHLDVADPAFVTVATNVRQEIAGLSLDGGLGGQTLWDNLIELSGRYLFAVVPLIDRTLIVPWNPCLRSAYKDVYATEYSNVERGSNVPLQLRAMALYGTFSADAGGNAGDSDGFKDIGLGGVYAPGGVEGVVKIIPAPSWLAGVAAQLYTRVGGGGPGGLVRNAGAAPVAGAPAPPADPGAALGGLKDTLNKFARAAYHNEVLAFRTATLSGKFRLDIAPGSIVRVHVTPEKFLADDDLGKVLYGAVTGVILDISAEAGRCQTVLRLAHVRSEEENKSDRFTAAVHPLYKTTWKGERLDL